MINLFIVFSLINGITAAIFGIFVYLKNKQKLINKTFFLMSFGVAVWSLSYCQWLLMTEQGPALFWSKMLNFGATLIPIFYLHWVLSLLNLAKIKRKLLTAGYLITFIFLILSFTPYYIKSVKPILFFLFWPQAGPLYICFLILGYFGLTGCGLYQLLQARKTASKDKRLQINYVILGSIIGFSGGATNFPLMLGIPLILPIGQPLVFFYVLSFAFATIKYHLFNIKVFLIEFLVSIIGLILLVQAVIAETFWLKILGFGIFAIFCTFGYLLIKSIIKEIEYREKLQIAYSELKRLDKAKSEFISIASHQLRTPLTAIKGYISMMREKSYGKPPEKMEKPLKNIYLSNERLIKLVNDLLNISRIEAGKIEIKLEKTSIENVIISVVEELENTAKEKNIYLRFEKPKKHLAEILVDREKIRQVIMNIIDNAIKYTKKGGVTIKSKIENLKFKIIVSDTGTGLTKYEISKMFESFSRGVAGTRLYTEGVGLGLYIARRFIEMHQGKIRAESKGKNKGSIFYIELPIK